MTDEDDGDAHEETRTNTRGKHQPNAAVYSSHCFIHSILSYIFFLSSVLSLRLNLPPFIFDFLLLFFLFFSRLLLHTVRFPFISTQFYSNCTCALCICRIFYARNASNLLFMMAVSKRKEKACVCVFTHSSCL